MRLSNEWFTALSENESGQLVTVSGRDELTEFIQSGKFKERVEITWKYKGDDKGMPSEALAEKMEEVQEVLRKAMEKDKLSILTGVYTGGEERIWVYYTRTVRVFGERLNEALAPFEMLPLSIYTEVDPEWEEYLDMYEMKEWLLNDVLPVRKKLRDYPDVEYVRAKSRHSGFRISLGPEWRDIYFCAGCLLCQ